MFNRLKMFSSLAAVTVAVGLLLGQAQAADPIKIAAPFGLSGPEGPFAKPYVAALELAVKFINDNGGIKSMGGAPLELVLQDSQSDPTTVTRLLREMKDQGAVVAVAPFASGLVLAAKPVLNEIDLPLLVPSLAKKITEDNANHVLWRISNTDEALVNDAMDFLEAQIKAGRVDVKSIGIVAQAGGAGAPFAAAIETRANAMGLKVTNISYDAAETKDFGPIVAQLKDANVDLVTGFMYTAGGLLFAEAYLLQDWKPAQGFFWMAGGHGEYGFRKELGQDTANWMDAGFAATSGCAPMQKFAADFEASYGEPLVGLVQAAPATIAVIADALERAGSTDPAKVKAALAATDIDYCELPLYALAGGAKFNAAGDNERFEPTIIQHEGDLGLMPVWPEGLAARPAIWPAR
jgi:branched-chain amino acid transport system substrate-binding protein